MKKIKLVMMPLLLSFLIVFTSATRIDGDKEIERMHNAANVLKEFGKPDEGIPHDLISEAEGIVIIPKLINAGLVIGGRLGKGVAVIKLENGKWSDPVFISLAGGSIGAQIGVQSVDLVLVFKHKGVLAKAGNHEFTIGGDVSANAGPISRSKSASTDYKFEAEVYSYSHSRGLFAGVTINGSHLGIDKDAIANFYGSDMSSEDLFATSKNSSESVKILKDALNSL